VGLIPLMALERLVKLPNDDRDSIALGLYESGISPSKIATKLGVSVITVYRSLWKKNYSPRGMKAWITPERNMAISRKLMGHTVPPEVRKKIGTSQAGEKHYNWKGGANSTERGRVRVNVGPGKRYRTRSRVVMEKIIGRPLSRTEVVHHINGIKDDDRPENMMIFEDNSSHIHHHHNLLRSEGIYGFQKKEKLNV
jgi:hypothetical protein